MDFTGETAPVMGRDAATSCASPVDAVVLQESWRRFQTLLEGLENVPVQGYDEQRRVISWNRASTLVYGYTAAEALGRRLEELIIPPAMREQVVAHVDAWLAGGPAIPAAELVLQDRDGQPVPVYSSHVMHTTVDGAREMYCIDVDLRPLRRAESERAALAAEQAALTAQLQHAQRLEAIGCLAGGVAHDFNNLLQVIGGYTSLAQADLPGDHPARRALEHVTGAVDRATSLIEQLLAFSRRDPLCSEVVDLAALVEELLPLVRRLIGENITVSFAKADDPPATRGDPAQLEQVLMNLCINARDAMPRGGHLALAVHPADGPVQQDDLAGRPPGAWAGASGEHVVLTVRDEGCGMDTETRERIFEPFYTTKSPGKGTGLGLSTVHGMIRQHGGDIHCTSAPGAGTTFTVRLPAVAPVSPSAPAAATPATASGPP
jgi:PAS domain S-box-containing protein